MIALTYTIIVLISFAALGIVAFLIWKNYKDEKKIIREMNEARFKTDTDANGR